ncbi:tyrosine-type recombinase/integrase [Diaphorobacter sp. LR2014-1]|uniref:tyrosine-type recombinase/integrase n=1 Tax=Diaphorobacter sp. LR2014-1 TaxID=1933219 RepID=UPI000CDB6DF0|nr:tyrosine-type recombinase/integrase [Diaphorobacter sp. LR2014-1]
MQDKRKSPAKIGKKPAMLEVEDGRALVERAVRELPNNIAGQISFFFSYYRIPASKGRKRSVSSATTKKYVYAIFALINTLSDVGIKINNLTQLTHRHLKIVFEQWEAKDTSASTLTTYFSCIKRMYEWIDNPLPQKSASELVSSKKVTRRTRIATKSKAWSENGVDIQAVIDKVTGLNAYAGLYLELCMAFGLRVLEAASLKPADSDRGDYLLVILGSKGGRGRTVPYTTEYQRQVISKAHAMASSSGVLRPRGWKVTRAVNSFYHYLRVAGVNMKKMGVTTHGLRHEYAALLYEQVSGDKPPVVGDKVPEKDTDQKARAVVTEALGHSRLDITSAYLGSVPAMSRERKKHLAMLNGQLTSPQSHLVRAAKVLQSHLSKDNADLDLRVYITGVEANGQLMQGMPLLTCAGWFLPNGLRSSVPITPEQMRTLEEAVARDTSRRCVMQSEGVILQDEERFELMLPL